MQITQGTTAAEIVASNLARKSITISNTGITVIYLALGGTPTTANYHAALQACAVANDGKGGSFTSTAWRGAISAISSGIGGTLTVAELL